MTDAGTTINSTESLQLLYQLSSRLATSFDLQSAMEQILTLSVEYLGTERGSIVVLEDNLPIDAALMYDHRIFFNNAPQFADIVKRGLIAWVLENHEAAFVNNTIIDPRWLKREDDQPDQTGAKSAMCFPLEVDGESVGVVTIVHPAPDFFTQEQFEFLKIAADQAAVAINNSLHCSALIASQHHYLELFNDNILPNLITDFKGMIIEANKAALDMLQLDEYELRSKSILDLHQAPLHIFGDDFDNLITGQVEKYETILHLNEEDSIQVKVSVRMLPFEATGKLTWLLEDITKEKQLEAVRSDMSAMIYHDIRSPLSNVISSLELLKMMLPDHDDENIDEVLSVISRSTNRVQRLVSNLLDIDRLEDEQHFVDFEEIDTREMADSVISDIRPILDSRSQEFSYNISPGIQETWGDEDMLKRVLINLLENAVKYSPMRGAIHFDVKQLDSGEIRFIVEDNGPGIPKEQLESIFKKFTRVNNRKGPKGIGMGLAFCKLAIDGHGGKIWAESDGEQGTRFIFDLPNITPEK